MATSLPPAFAVSAQYDRLLQSALRRFFDRAVLETTPSTAVSQDGRLSIETTDDPAALALRWFGTRHALRVPPGQPFSEHEVRMARSIAGVLEARFSAIFDPRLMAERADLFQGTIDDRYIGAFLDGGSYVAGAGVTRADQIASAIEVLRVAALSSYENRPISSGVLLLDDEHDPCAQRRVPAAPLTYSEGLTAVKSFYRLCDGLKTVVLANRRGHLVDIVDIGRWGAQYSGGRDLDVPCAMTFRPHALATQRGRHVCVVLSPAHEIKVFAEGMQVFGFRSAGWHLLDVGPKYAAWLKAVGNPLVAQRLFQVALDLADGRVGALFVVLRNAMSAMAELVRPQDLIMDNPARPATASLSRRDFAYLLSSRSVISMDQSVLEGLASMDGATVCDRDGRLVAVGAILRHPASAPAPATGTTPTEGARSTAALAASRFGPVMKVSEDGVISCFDRVKLWEL
jgi:hypothetical protein